MTEFTSRAPSKCVSPGSKERSAPDADRRLLLRAAVSAPLLATIPSGTAFANASAFQCVVTAKTQSDQGGPPLSHSEPDHWVRIQVVTRQFGMIVNGNPVGKDGWFINSLWYEATGSAFDPQPNLATPDAWPDNCDTNTEFCPVTEAEPAWVLAIYRPQPDGVSPTSVVPAASGLNAFYPISSTQGDPVHSQPGNIGLFVSCYCSVSPTIQNPDAVQQALMSTYCNL